MTQIDVLRRNLAHGVLPHHTVTGLGCAQKLRKWRLGARIEGRRRRAPGSHVVVRDRGANRRHRPSTGRGDVIRLGVGPPRDRGATWWRQPPTKRRRDDFWNDGTAADLRGGRRARGRRRPLRSTLTLRRQRRGPRAARGRRSEQPAGRSRSTLRRGIGWPRVDAGVIDGPARRSRRAGRAQGGWRKLRSARQRSTGLPDAVAQRVDGELVGGAMRSRKVAYRTLTVPSAVVAVVTAALHRVRPKRSTAKLQFFPRSAIERNA